MRSAAHVAVDVLADLYNTNGAAVSLGQTARARLSQSGAVTGFKRLHDDVDALSEGAG